MHALKYNKDACKTYHEVCMKYGHYFFHGSINTRNDPTTDGYDDPYSRKMCEMLRRYKRITLQFQFSESIPNYDNQNQFFGNAQNQKQLIIICLLYFKK